MDEQNRINRISSTGPVVGAAVIFSENLNYIIKLVDVLFSSKKISPNFYFGAQKFFYAFFMHVLHIKNNP